MRHWFFKSREIRFHEYLLVKSVILVPIFLSEPWLFILIVNCYSCLPTSFSFVQIVSLGVDRLCWTCSGTSCLISVMSSFCCRFLLVLPLDQSIFVMFLHIVDVVRSSNLRSIGHCKNKCCIIWIEHYNKILLASWIENKTLDELLSIKLVSWPVQ